MHSRVVKPSERGCCHAGIGQKRALELVQKHGSLEKVLAALDPAKYGIPEPFPYKEARELFKREHAQAVSQ